MAKNKNTKKAKWRQEGGKLVATVFSGPLDQIRLERQARREQAKANGQLGSTSGTGAHGGNKRDQRRRDRRNQNANLRKGDE